MNQSFAPFIALNLYWELLGFEHLITAVTRSAEVDDNLTENDQSPVTLNLQVMLHCRVSRGLLLLFELILIIVELVVRALELELG